jgi:hypothetical protein
MCTVQLMKKMLDASKTRKNCFRYLKLMSPINAALLSEFLMLCSRHGVIVICDRNQL